VRAYAGATWRWASVCFCCSVANTILILYFTQRTRQLARLQMNFAVGGVAMNCALP